MSGRNGYLQLLRRPGAIAFSSSGFVGRMSMSMYGLGTVLLIASLTGRYGLAGTVAATGSIGFAALSPVIAGLADRLGQRRVLLVQASVFAVGAVAFIGSAQLRAPVWLLLVTGAVAGASMPSVGSMVRTRWSVITGGDPREMHTAFALESVNDELIFVIGPALVTLLATQLIPASGLGAAVVLCLAGTVVFACQRRTEPPAKPRPQSDAASRGLRLRRLLDVPAAGLVTLAPAFLLLGSFFASIDLSTVAFATDLGRRPESGIVLGIFALGSAVGGLWYGSRHWRAPIGRRFIITSALAVSGFTTFWALPGLLAISAVGFLSAMAVAPTLMAGYAILERQAPEHRSTEAMAWLGSTISVGVALGSAACGHLIDAYGARVGFGFAASCGAVAVLICLAGHARLRTEQDQPQQLAQAGIT